MSKLNKLDMEALFARLDQSAREILPEGHHLEIVMIGSAFLIHDGMPDRTTIDIDLWGVSQKERDLLQRISKGLIDFDPNDYRDREKPYLQIVWPDFAQMPLNETWQEENELVWEGAALRIMRPPIGVALGSKLAAGRAQDIIDANFIVDSYPEWRESLQRWSKLFSEENQENITDNMIFLELHLANKINPPNKPGSAKP